MLMNGQVTSTSSATDTSTSSATGKEAKEKVENIIPEQKMDIAAEGEAGYGKDKL